MKEELGVKSLVDDCDEVMGVAVTSESEAGSRISSDGVGVVARSSTSDSICTVSGASVVGVLTVTMGVCVCITGVGVDGDGVIIVGDGVVVAAGAGV